MGVVTVTHFTDPSCPWAYSASPAMSVLRWRYGAQLRWRVVTIGLSEDASRYIANGYTPAMVSAGHLRFRRFGMPFARTPRSRIVPSSRACRAIVASRLLDPGRESEALRALQLAWFNSTLLLDEGEQIEQALARVDGLDAAAVVAAIEDEGTLAAYEEDKAEARTAAGSATELQGKARQTDGPVRYSAPSLVFAADAGMRLEAGGFQPAEAYDVVVANLDPGLERRGPAEAPLEALEQFPEGLVTAEVAAIMTVNNELPDRDRAEGALIALVAEGAARRVALGDDALWLPA